MGVTKIEKIGKAEKHTYEDGEHLYLVKDGRILVKSNNDDFETTNWNLTQEDRHHFQKMKYSIQTEKYGTANAVEFVEYLIINNIFFFDDTIDQGFLLNISKGIVSGHYDFKASGFSGSLTSIRSDIWTPGGNFTGWITAAETIDLISDNVADDVGGIGAETVKCIGLDENWELQYEIISMDGTTPVTTLGTWMRLFTVDVVQAGVYGGRNIGTITATGNTSSAVLGEVPPLNGRFQSVIFTVPKGYTYYMDTILFQLDAGKTASFYLETRNNANNVSSIFSPWIIRHEAILIQNTFTVNPRVPTRYREYTDITVKAQMDVGSGSGAAHLTGVFLRNDMVTQDFTIDGQLIS